MDESRDPAPPQAPLPDAAQAPPPRDRLARVLTAAAVASAIVWAVTSVALEFATAFGAGLDRHFISERGFSGWDLMRLVEGVSYAVFVASAGLFLVLWLDRRWREGR